MAKNTKIVPYNVAPNKTPVAIALKISVMIILLPYIEFLFWDP